MNIKMTTRRHWLPSTISYGLCFKSHGPLTLITSKSTMNPNWRITTIPIRFHVVCHTPATNPLPKEYSKLQMSQLSFHRVVDADLRQARTRYPTEGPSCELECLTLWPIAVDNRRGHPLRRIAWCHSSQRHSFDTVLSLGHVPHVPVPWWDHGLPIHNPPRCVDPTRLCQRWRVRLQHAPYPGRTHHRDRKSVV